MRGVAVATMGLVLAFCAGGAHGGTIAYWQFDDGTPPNAAGTLVSQNNSPTLDGTAAGNGGGPLPTFDTALPGTIITDGLGGPTINADNGASLSFYNTGGTTSNTGSLVRATDPGGAGSLLKPASFTIEAFIRVDQTIAYPTIVAKTRADAGGSSWLLDTNSNTSGTLRARLDTQTLGATSGSGFNQNFSTSAFVADGAWHHVAMTYDGTTRGVKLFVDYAQVGSGTATNALVYDDQPFVIGDTGGGRAFDGWIDEVRLSETVLTSDQFLHAVPEPTTIALLVCGLLGAIGWYGFGRRAH